MRTLSDRLLFILLIKNRSLKVRIRNTTKNSILYNIVRLGASCSHDFYFWPKDLG